MIKFALCTRTSCVSAHSESLRCLSATWAGLLGSSQALPVRLEAIPGGLQTPVSTPLVKPNPPPGRGWSGYK